MLLIARGRRGDCNLLFAPFSWGGDGTVTAESLFAAAAKDAAEDIFGSTPVSFLDFFDDGFVLLVSFLDGTILLVIVSVGTNLWVWYFMGGDKSGEWVVRGVQVSVISDTDVAAFNQPVWKGQI